MSETVNNGRVSKKALELFLQNLQRPDSYNIKLEQYVTDPVTAANLLFLAYGNGDVRGRMIADLGSGSGILACGAAFMGAEKVFAVELDPVLAALSAQNGRDYDIEVRNIPVSSFDVQVDTVLMNPPFGSVVPASDRAFLEKAASLGRMIYSIHNAKSDDWISRFYSEKGSILARIQLTLTIPHLYPHHRSAIAEIPAVAYVVAVDH